MDPLKPLLQGIAEAASKTTAPAVYGGGRSWEEVAMGVFVGVGVNGSVRIAGTKLDRGLRIHILLIY